MLGEIHTSVLKYYDTKANTNKLKARPVLIIGDERNNDYTVLPISSVSIKSNIDSEYDIEIDPAKYPLLNLTKLCYLRTHKQCTVHKSSIIKKRGDLKNNYPDLFLEAMGKLEQWNRSLLDDNLK